MLLALLLVGQFALPRVAEDVVRDRLGNDEVEQVEVDALPAVELLWRHADRVSARVRSYDAQANDVADDIAQTAGVQQLDVRIERVRAAAGLELRDVLVEKRDGVLHGSAVLDPGQLAAALPAGVEGELVPRADGAVVVDARIAGAPVRLRVEVVDGRVVARPEGLLGLLTSYTLFADPRIDVERVSAEPGADGRVLLRAQARVR
ncbi:hypothetical protein VSS74_11615 [Conexibacter stalactiti]|uniref:DUF2993 domain-containing protein n=1 Tax=Conexibacter stalactiti TaxID=1940611 RepID=A0ABU4HP17_9ACTN|nr:hypothetical protein [Conexibacter stalactiti]MDW5594990.1 hypothetical protein [Conexibacter stalactiti]MEC5035632.1 hypothetical protein [Conexibacter stalactiti]